MLQRMGLLGRGPARGVGVALTRAFLTPASPWLAGVPSDLTNFYKQYKSIEPWLKRKDTKANPNVEYLQTADDRKKLDGMYEVRPVEKWGGGRKAKAPPPAPPRTPTPCPCSGALGVPFASLALCLAGRGGSCGPVCTLLSRVSPLCR